MTSRNVVRKYFYRNEQDIPKVMEVNYSLWYGGDGKLCDIRNEYYHSVDKNSEVWEFYNS